MVKIWTILNCAKNYFLSKLFVPLIKGSVSPQFYAIFGKLNFEGISTGAHLTKWWKFELSQFVLRKYFLAKLFIWLIKRSVSPQFYAIFRKMNFWRNIDRRGLYKNGDNLNYLKLCKEIIFWQNYLFHSSKEVFLHNFTQFLENWIFEGISTGADLTKMVKICIILICSMKIFFGKIIYSTHQKKCFSTILRNFWKIEFLKEYRQARTLQKWWKFELSEIEQRNYFVAKLFVPLIKGRVSPQF